LQDSRYLSRRVIEEVAKHDRGALLGSQVGQGRQQLFSNSIALLRSDHILVCLPHLATQAPRPRMVDSSVDDDPM
jgi:hypothetical protein